jgi:hypothetical protein
VRGKTYLRLLLGVLLALLMAACSGGSGSPAPDFTIDLSDKNLTMQQFGIAYTDLTLTPQHGFSGTVELR